MAPTELSIHETARTPADRFIARMELAQSRSSQSALDTFLVRIKQDVVEQQKRFAAEKEPKLNHSN